MRYQSRPGLRRSRAIWECPDQRPSGLVFLGKSQTWTGTAGFGPVQTGSQSVQDRTSPTLYRTGLHLSMMCLSPKRHCIRTFGAPDSPTSCCTREWQRGMRMRGSSGKRMCISTSSPHRWCGRMSRARMTAISIATTDGPQQAKGQPLMHSGSTGSDIASFL